jgi:hypothetical protein
MGDIVFVRCIRFKRQVVAVSRLTLSRDRILRPAIIFGMKVIQHFANGRFPIAPGGRERVLDQPLAGVAAQNGCAKLAFER